MLSLTSKQSSRSIVVKFVQKTIDFGKKRKLRKHRENILKSRKIKQIKKLTLKIETLSELSAKILTKKSLFYRKKKLNCLRL